MRRYKKLMAAICSYLSLISGSALGALTTENLTKELLTACLTLSTDRPLTTVVAATPQEVAQLLGWVRDFRSNTLCGGYYSAPSAALTTLPPANRGELPIKVAASEKALLTKQGISLLTGDVTFSQPGRELKADCVAFFREAQHRKIIEGILLGHATLYEYNRLLVAAQGVLDFQNELYTLTNGWYRVLANTPSGVTNVWGKAKQAVRTPSGIIKMQHATYSACPPDAVSWHVWSKKLTLDRNSGRGTALHALLYLRKAPLFYLPFFSFPLDKRRISGFLYPNIGYNKESGYGVTLPYYFNLAPNYDVTFTPTIFTNRGILFNSLMRYLTASSVSTIDISYIPHDRAFANLREQAAFYPPSHARSLLQKSATDRGFISGKSNLTLTPHWSSNLTFNYVTDDYFLQDFGTTYEIINKDQLFNQAELRYEGEQWHFLSRIAGLQTLHPIKRSGTNQAEEQYWRLPQLTLAGEFPRLAGKFNYTFTSEFINFVKRANFESGRPEVAGLRMHIASALSSPLQHLGGYIIPKLQLQATTYKVHDRTKVGAPNNLTMVLPLLSIDSGALFSKSVTLFNRPYTQTLEPRLFYLWVPAKNQQHNPVFDTVLPPFDFNQLFRTNRFSGVDRIGDAQQITAAFTTRLLNEYGNEQLHLGVGQIIALHKHQVTVNKGRDPLEKAYLSPIVGQLQYSLFPQLLVTANVSWDPNYHRFNTNNINIQYDDGGARVVNFWYNHTLQGDNIYSPQEVTNNLSTVGCSLGWKLGHHWHLFGQLEYNISYQRTQEYLYGLEYDSCCWALRLVRGGIFIGDSNNNYEERVYLQFVLKGLGTHDLIGNLEGVLPGKIRGYNDQRIMGL